MLKKFFVLSTVIALVFSLFSPMSSHANGDSIDWKTYYGELDADEEMMIETALEVSNYFEENADGSIIFTADIETLMDMGITESDAELMISAGKELSHNQIQPDGFVGIHLNLGPRVRNMTAWAVGVFAGGYVGWYAKQFAVNPITAGVAALITAGTGLAVGNAVKKGLKRVSVGMNIPGISLSYTVNIP
ncbi:hypothetical protein [Sutcliffiella horikoshii]|uniref:hypothetical protein n=1 Tax=Sutcliffiella horikoshii TaxID=79883 RepID=UPI00385039BB